MYNSVTSYIAKYYCTQFMFLQLKSLHQFSPELLALFFNKTYKDTRVLYTVELMNLYA